MTIRFDEFEVALDTRELRQNATPVATEPKVFDLLVYLIDNAHRVVSRDDMIEGVWDGRIVSDATVSSCVKAVRKALGDSGRAQRYVRTIHGRGFRFVGSFEAPTQGAAPSAERRASKGSSLAILPFDVPQDDTALAGPASDLADDLLTTLNRIPLLSLASRRSARAFAANPDTRPDVTYLVEGSLSRRGENLHARLQLIRTESGFSCWAQRFEVPSGEDTGKALLTAILPRLETAIVQSMVADNSQSEGPESTRAQLIRAMGVLSLKGWNRAAFAEAEQVLRDLLQRDPDQPIARAYLALILGIGSRIGIFAASATLVAETIAEAERALDLAGADSTVLGIAACALADVGHPERAIPLLRKAIGLNPNNAQAWVALGAALLLTTDLDGAVEALEHGIEISAMNAEIAIWWSFLAVAELMRGNADKAHAHGLTGCQADDRNHIPRLVLAAACQARGDRIGAERALRDALRITPDVTDREVLLLTGRDLGAALLDQMAVLRA